MSPPTEKGSGRKTKVTYSKASLKVELSWMSPAMAMIWQKAVKIEDSSTPYDDLFQQFPAAKSCRKDIPDNPISPDPSSLLKALFERSDESY